MKVCYKIMGVPSRMENILKLKSILDLSDGDIFLDTEYRKNPMWTWKQTVKNIDEEFSHVVVIQDDAILCNDFKEFCEYLIKRFPSSIFTLSNNYDVSKSLPSGVIFQPGYCTGGLATIIPILYIDNIIKTQEERFPEHTEDDNMICYWAYHNDVKVLSTHPSVVNSYPNSSLLNHNGNVSKNFCNKPLGKKWANATNKPLYTNRDWSTPSNVVLLNNIISQHIDDKGDDITFVIPNREGKHNDFVCDRIKDFFPESKFIIVTQNDNTLFKRGQLINIGCKYVDTEYVCIMDNDVFFSQEIDLKKSLGDNIAIAPFTRITQVKIIPGGYKKLKSQSKHPNGKGRMTFMRTRDFFKYGGFSNLYIGYGYEDNDFDAHLGGIKDIEGTIYHISHKKRSTKDMYSDGYLNRDLFLNRNKQIEEGVDDTTCDIQSDSIINGIRHIYVNNINEYDKINLRNN